MVRAQAGTIQLVQTTENHKEFVRETDSGTALRDNLKRLLRHVPRSTGKTGRTPKYARLKFMSESGQRYLMSGDKSPTLETLDKIAAQLNAPGWMLIHPDMELLDSNIEWISHIIRTYVNAGDEERDSIQRAVLQAEKIAALQ